MINIKLTEKQRKDFLRSFSEREIQQELQILFEKMYKTPVYILQGTQEFGKDLIIKIEEPVAIRYISVVVKMGDISGAVKDKQLMIIRNQIEQSFEKDFYISEEIGPNSINEVFVVLFGKFSNNAQDNLHIFIEKRYPRQVKLFDINKMDKFFLNHYPEVFCGASGLEALTSKDSELDGVLLGKDAHILTSFIDPNIRRFDKKTVNLLPSANLSDDQMLVKTLNESLFGIKESITTFAQKLLCKNQNVLVEGEAGSGKSVFCIKLAQTFINLAIKDLVANKKSDGVKPIKVPILISALELSNNSVDFLVKNYYRESTYNFTPVAIIVDGLDEVKRQSRIDTINNCIAYAKQESLSLVMTSRKNYNLIDDLDGFLHYEILAFETTQAVNYIKKLITNNSTLLTALLKGLEQIEHQIPLFPMALSLLVEIVKEHNEVPASISELYSRYVNLVLGEKDSSKGIEVLFEYKIKKNFLGQLSYELFFDQSVVSVDYNLFYDFVKKYVANRPHISNADNFIVELKRSSLLKFDEKAVEFLHKSFLDYFIADYFLSSRDELEETDDFDRINGLYYDELWGDVALFYFGIQTKITKSRLHQIIEIGKSKIDGNSSVLIFAEIFMLGRLMQYAWDTNSDAKTMVIENATSIIMPLKKELFNMLEDATGIKELPTISADIGLLHLFDISYSSLFLVKEIEGFVKSNFERLKLEATIEDSIDIAIVYFCSIFVLTNHKLLGNSFVSRFVEDFLCIENRITDKEVVVPIVGLFNFLLKKEILDVDEKTKGCIEKDYKALSKRFKHIITKTFVAKGRKELPYYRREH